MSAAVDQFCDKLRDRLNAIEGQLRTVKATIQSRSEEAGKALRGKLDEARAKLQAQKERVDQARANLKAMAEQKTAETKEAASEREADRATGNLEARADRAEAYAGEAITYALAGIDMAAEAVLDAVVARLDADGTK
jgi:chromosome segregation ATPase